jgi:hypothetical protein
MDREQPFDPRPIRPPHPQSERLELRIEKRQRKSELGFWLEAWETEMDQRRPVVIGGVEDSTPAHRAGLQAGDIIWSVNGHRITVPSNMKEMVARALVGDVVMVALRPPPRVPWSRQTRCAVAAGVAALAVSIQKLPPLPHDEGDGSLLSAELWRRSVPLWTSRRTANHATHRILSVQALPGQRTRPRRLLAAVHGEWLAPARRPALGLTEGCSRERACAAPSGDG